MALTIARITQADEAHWRKLWTAYLAFYNTELPEIVFETSFSRLVDPDVTDYDGRIAWAGDQPVGLVHWLYHRHGWKVEPVCYLQDLYVAEAARGTGAGRALIESCYAAADAMGAPSVYWMTQDFNTPARRLYDRIGEHTPLIKYQRRS